MHIAGADVVLQVHKFLGRPAAGLGVWHFPQRTNRAHLKCRHLGRLHIGLRQARRQRRTQPGLHAIAGAAGQIGCAVAGTGGALRLHRLARVKTGLHFVPDGFGRRLAVQVDDRAETTRHGQQITRPGARRSRQRAVGVELVQLDSGHGFAARGLNDHMTGQDFNALLARARAQIAVGRGPGVHHRHLGADLFQSQRGVVAVVVVGEDQSLLARQHGIAADVGGHRRGQHDAGQVVVGKHQRALVRAGGQHHLLGAHLPHHHRPGQCLGRPESAGAWHRC